MIIVFSRRLNDHHIMRGLLLLCAFAEVHEIKNYNHALSRTNTPTSVHVSN
jgi:hypothetical protein